MKLPMSRKRVNEIIVFIIIFQLIFLLLVVILDKDEIDYELVISSLISIISIFSAIIITFLFSKIFSEKNLRIERKKLIDEYALKIFHLRRIAYNIRSCHNTWKIYLTESSQTIDIKSLIDSRYNDLTYNDYRQEGYEENIIPPEELLIINNEIKGEIGQGYLSLKGLENNAPSLFFSKKNVKINYSVIELEKFDNYINSFWYMLEHTSTRNFSFQTMPDLYLDLIKESYFYITNNDIDTDCKKAIKKLFSEFSELYLDKCYYLTKLNSNRLPTIKNMFVNMCVFLFILILSFLLVITGFDNDFIYLATILLVSLFFLNFFYLLHIIWKATTKELSITDFFRL